MGNVQSESVVLQKKAESLLNKLDKQQTKGEKLDVEPVKAIFKDLLSQLKKLETICEESDNNKEPEETQNQFWQLLNFAPAGFLVLNSNGVILQANATFARMTGQSIEKLLQTSFIELIHPDDRNIYNNQLKSMKNLSGNEVEIRIRGYNDYVWTIVSGHANRVMADSEDYKGSMLFAITDITYKKRVEKEEKLLCQRINNFQQAESLGLLASGMAHDFNNILTVIMGNAEMLEINNKQDDLQLFIRGIISASGKAAKLIGQMLDYSGEGQSKIEKLDANHLIKDISAFLRSFVPTTISLSFDLEKSEARIECDPEQLKKL
ncbi:MAG: Sensor protein, partial [uncultured bacterium]